MLGPEELLSEVVAELGPIADDLVFVGGATVWLYLDRARMGEIRPTDDADAVAAVSSYAEYSKVLDRLRDRGIGARAGQQGPTCRVQTPRGHVMDVMPSRDGILGFGNPWFEEGVMRAWEADIGGGKTVRIFPAPVFFAAKVSAYLDRGKDDPWTSDDLHDLLVLLDCRPALPDEVSRESNELQAAIADFANHLLGQPALDELVAGHLGASAPGWRERAAAVMAAIEQLGIAGA